MQKYLSMAVKDVINEFPKVGEILDEFLITCSTCSVGTCLLKDVVEIHNLSSEQSKQLMNKIETIIYSKKDVAETVSASKALSEKAVSFSEPVDKLVEEHKLIKRMIAWIPQMLAAQQELERVRILEALDFIKSYADRYHHAKEEDILFNYTDKNEEIIQAMYTEHDLARNHVKKTYEALEKNDFQAVRDHLLAYSKLLTEHIKKEDEILYPWIERQLNDKDLDELLQSFLKVDKENGTGKQEKYEGIVRKLEKL